jgi:hypothetical protein
VVEIMSEQRDADMEMPKDDESYGQGKSIGEEGGGDIGQAGMGAGSGQAPTGMQNEDAEREREAGQDDMGQATGGSGDMGQDQDEMGQATGGSGDMGQDQSDMGQGGGTGGD